MDYRMYRPNRDRSKKRQRRNVHIFAQVTAKIEPAILKRFNEQEQTSRLRHVSNEAGVEIICNGLDFAFQGTWKAVAQAQAALKSMYVKSVSDAIEDRLSDNIYDDDRVTLRTSKCGSVFSGSSNHSARSKIFVGNLTERVAMAIERSSSVHSQTLSDDSSKRQSHTESDKDTTPLKPRNQRQDEDPVPQKRTSLFSNLIHHKKSYIYKCSALAQAYRNEKENDSTSSNLHSLGKELPQLQTELPFMKQESMSSVCEAPSPSPAPLPPKAPEPMLSPPPVHYDPVYEPRFIPAPFPATTAEPAFQNPLVYPRVEAYPVDPHFQAPAPVMPRLLQDPPVPTYSPIPISHTHPSPLPISHTHPSPLPISHTHPSPLPIPPLQPQHPGYIFESVSHETFFHQNRGFLPNAFGLPPFPEHPVQETKARIPGQWDALPTPPQPSPYLASQSPPGEFKCDRCTFITPHRRNLTHHEKRAHSERLHKCHLCEKGYGLKADLNLHLRSHDTKHRCEECGKTYKSHRVLKQHQLTHDGSYIKPTFFCSDCGKSFSTKYVLQNHMDNVHNGKQPAFVCQICDKRFTQKHSLTEHQNIHLGLKPFKCDTCQKSFSFRTSLSQHMLLHGAERNYQCNVCGKSFLQKNSLRLHSAIHSDNRAHCCSYCGKGFTQKQAMLRHERIHNGEKPYSCEICGRAFNDSSILRRHMHVHRKDQPSANPTTEVVTMVTNSVGDQMSSDRHYLAKLPMPSMSRLVLP